MIIIWCSKICAKLAYTDVHASLLASRGVPRLGAWHSFGAAAGVPYGGMVYLTQAKKAAAILARRQRVLLAYWVAGVPTVIVTSGVATPLLL